MPELSSVMVGNWTGEVKHARQVPYVLIQTKVRDYHGRNVLFEGNGVFGHLIRRDECVARRAAAMTDTRIKPYQQQAAEDERRAEQRRLYRRNQVFGLLIVAGLIVAWWLFHTHPGWIFPRGWWRP